MNFLGSRGSNYRGYFIGDSGYNQRAKMMISILDPVGKADIAYNKAHKKCRCGVERSIGVLKSRFRCLCKQSGGAIQFDVDIACSIIGACAVLHNYCRFRNIPFEVAADIEADITRKDTSNATEEDEKERYKLVDDVIVGYRAREEVVAAYFS